MPNKTHIPDGWRQVCLGDVAEIVTGSTPSREVSEYYGGNVPWVKPSDLASGRLVNSSEEYLTEAGVAVSRKVSESAVLVSCIGTIGEVAISRVPLCFNQQINALIPYDAVLSSFLYWVCDYKASYLRSIAAKTAVPILNKTAFSTVSITLPPLAEQQAIAAVLDSIDDAIEGAKAVIAATGQLRDSLLHQLLTRGVPGWHSEWREVPGLGTIPADWEVVRLGEVAEVAFSSVDKKTIEGEIPVRLCNYTDVFYNRRIRPEMDFMSASANLVEQKKWNLKKGDVLFTKDSETPDEIGVPAFVEADMPNVLCGYHLGLARPNTRLLDGAYLAEAFGSPKLAVQFARIANGVTRFGLTLGATSQLPIPLPPLAEQEAISGLLDGVDVALEYNKAARDKMIAAKESAVDALLTGRVRVR